jgi:hypothetical protein
MRRVAQTKAPASPERVRSADRKLTVKPRFRPEIDVQMRAEAFHYLALDLTKKKRAEQQKEYDQGRSRQ